MWGIHRTLKLILHLVREIRDLLKFLAQVNGFTIEQIQGDNSVAITGVGPGAVGTFKATPTNNGNPASLPPGVVPIWTSSDTTNAPITSVSPDGLTAQVTVAPTAAPGTQFVLTVTATLPDNTQPNGTATVPILTLEVNGFVIDQTS
jgi:hypothetical protein